MTLVRTYWVQRNVDGKLNGDGAHLLRAKRRQESARNENVAVKWSLGILNGGRSTSEEDADVITQTS